MINSTELPDKCQFSFILTNVTDKPQKKVYPGFPVVKVPVYMDHGFEILYPKP